MAAKTCFQISSRSSGNACPLKMIAPPSSSSGRVCPPSFLMRVMPAAGLGQVAKTWGEFKEVLSRVSRAAHTVPFKKNPREIARVSRHTRCDCEAPCSQSPVRHVVVSGHAPRLVLASAYSTALGNGKLYLGTVNPCRWSFCFQLCCCGSLCGAATVVRWTYFGRSYCLRLKKLAT